MKRFKTAFRYWVQFGADSKRREMSNQALRIGAVAAGIALVWIIAGSKLPAAIKVPWPVAVLVMGLLAAAPLLSRRWKLALATFLVWLVFEDLARKLAGNDIRLYFIKDAVYATVLIALYRNPDIRQVWRDATGGTRIALYALVAWALVMAIPTGLSDLRLPMLGLRLDFLYAPLGVAGFLLASDMGRARRTLVAGSLLGGFASAVGLIQVVIGPQFLAPLLPTPGLMYLVLVRGGNVYRPTGTFVDPGRFDAMAVVTFAIALAATFLTRGRARGISLAAVVASAAAIWVSGGRTNLIEGAALIALPLGAMLIREYRRGLAMAGLLALGLVIAAVLLGVLFPSLLASRLAWYTSTLNPFSPHNEWAFRWNSYSGDIVKAFNIGGLFGNGTGSESIGKQYLYGGATRSLDGLYHVEGGYASVMVEWGLVGLALWLTWTALWFRRQVDVVRRLHRHPGGTVALVLAGWVFLFLFLGFVFGIQVYQNYYANAYFWLISGFIFGLPRAVQADRGLSAPWAVPLDETVPLRPQPEHASARRALVPVELAETPRVIVLAPDPGGLGGVQQVTRTLLKSLADLYGAQRVGLLQLWDHGGEATDYQLLERGVATDGNPVGRVTLTMRVRYLWAVVKYARLWKDDVVIVAAHAHLAPVAWVAAKLTRRPYVVWCHGLEVWGPMRFGVSMAIRNAAAVFTSNRFTAARVEKLVGLAAGNVEVFPYGLPSGYKSVVATKSPKPTVLAVARLSPADAYKGIDTLICAWPQVAARMPDAQLEIVGDGPDRARLMKIADTLGLNGNLHFAGRVSDEELHKAYARATVFAMPGRHSLGPPPEGEGFGMVFVEAGAAGLPVVAGRAAGALDAVGHEESGLLVDPNDPRDVADAIVRLLTDPELVARLGRGGKERAVGRFSFGVFKENVRRLVQSVA